MQTVFRLLWLSSILLFSPFLVRTADSQAPLHDSPAVEQRVDSMLAHMTTDDKIKLIGGVDMFFTQAIPSAGLPQFRMADGPMGVRNWGPSTAYPAGIALAATWDTALAQREGESLGNDARARGVHFLLGPGVNIYRSPRNGRNMEYFGEDPWLAGRVAVSYILGLQSKGVSGTVKHFDGNNSEFDRNRSDSIIDERAWHEIYLPAFEAAVTEGGVGAVMDSYNLINGEHSTQNHELNVDILKKSWGFQGVLMSDWDATYDGVAAANGGLDLEMPFAKFMNAKNLVPALQLGTVSLGTLDDKVRRILRIAVRFGWLDRDQFDASIPLYSPASSQTALDVATESITLLKNENRLLPLRRDRLHSIVVVGPGAYPAVPGGGGSSRVNPFVAESLLAGLTTALGAQAKVYYFPGLPAADQIFASTEFSSIRMGSAEGEADPQVMKRISAKHLNGWRPDDVYPGDGAPTPNGPARTYLWELEYTPATSGSYLLAAAKWRTDRANIVVDGMPVLANEMHDGRASARAVKLNLTQGKIVHIRVRCRSRDVAPRFSIGLLAVDAMFTAAQRKILNSADVVLVGVGTNPLFEGEGFDRTFALPWGQEDLIAEVASVNPRTIVDVQAGGAVDAHNWIDKVPVLIDSWYGGESAATALAEVLLGESPNGKLPISWECMSEDNPTFDHYEEAPGPGRRIPYSESIYLGYRYYTTKHKQPLFPFGFGLSYTTFQMSNLKLTTGTGDDRLIVEFDVRNTGILPGAEVPQVYVGDPSAKIDRPLKELKAFTRVLLAPGESTHVRLLLNQRAFSYWDVQTHGWRMDSGRFDITVGNSSEDDRLVGHLDLR